MTEIKRINWMDNLRTVIIFLVVVYHIGGIYESTGMWGFFWIVDNPETMPWVGIVGILFDTFIMPTMFFIAGYFIPSSLSKKTASGFVMSKIKRLLLPWLIAVLTLIPIYQFIFLYSRGIPQGNWIDYLFFNSPFSQSWLWFLPVLFAFSMLYLLIDKAGVKLEKIPFVPTVIISLVLSLGFSHLVGNLVGFRSWTNTPVIGFENERILAHFLFFIAGAMANKKGIFTTAPKGNVLYMIANAIGWIPVTVHIFLRIWPYMTEDFSVTPMYRILWFSSFHLASLAMVYMMVESFRRYGDKSGKIWNFLNRNSFGTYINHVVVLGVLGTLLLKIDLPVIVEWVLLIVSTYVVCNLVTAAYGSLGKVISGKKLKMQKI